MWSFGKYQMYTLKLKGAFPPGSDLERSRLSLDCLQKPEFSSCHLFGFSQPPGLMISWKAGQGCGFEGLEQVEQGFEIFISVILSHPKDLSSLIS